MSTKKHPYFHWLGYVEGLSLLGLLFFAMPYRYFTQDHSFVRAFGTAHGGLFMLYLVVAFTIAMDERWSIKKMIICLVAASLPFGTFWFEAKRDKLV